MSWTLYCNKCGFRGGGGVYYPWCPRCGGPLEVSGSLPSYPRILGEGSTPLVFDSILGNIIGFKLDYLNPSGSFKDRGVSYSLQFARDLGYKCVVVDSSGNTAISTALYSSKLGLNSIVIVPSTAHPSKISLMEALGSRVIVAESRSEASKLAITYSTKCYHVSHLTSPIFIEGVKSIGRELVEFSKELIVILPVSSGSLLVGLYRGYIESGGKPRIIAVQASEASSLEKYIEPTVSIGGDSSKLADALVVKTPPRLEEMAKIVKETNGALVKVGDKAIKEALGEILKLGFIVEPSSAVVWAAYKALVDKLRGKDIVLILTGSGLKYAGELRRIAEN
ncbi:MAG: pyridoxal-phosphate dependent enzyme [Acidilobaceae archaeon]